jgi:hypothetical protein
VKALAIVWLGPLAVDWRVVSMRSLFLIQVHGDSDRDTTCGTGKGVHLLVAVPDAYPGHDRRLARDAAQPIPLDHSTFYGERTPPSLTNRGSVDLLLVSARTRFCLVFGRQWSRIGLDFTPTRYTRAIRRLSHRGDPRDSSARRQRQRRTASEVALRSGGSGTCSERCGG